jgi:phage baseplate assembly protein V
MIGPFQNAIRLQAERATAGQEVTRVGIVQGYNPNNYTARVALQPEGLITGWLQVASIWIGDQWGMYAPPNIGDQVSVSFFEGALEAGYVELRFWNTVDKPLPVPSGEFWLVHAKGQFVRLTNDGKFTISDGQGATFTLDGAGNINSASKQWTHTGPVHFTDNVQVDKTLTATIDVIGGGKSLKTHTHSDPQGGNTGQPN